MGSSPYYLHGGPPVTRDYQDVMGRRRKRLAPGWSARREALETTYAIAVQLIELREQQGLTQAQLAERCGIDQGDISRIERGSTSPTAKTLSRIADALGAEVRIVARAS